MAAVRDKLSLPIGLQTSWQFWLLALLLTASFALGGSARGDVWQLMLLRPLSALVLGLGLTTLTAGQVKAHRFLFAMAAAIVALPALQLVPLPPDIWSRLPGRDLVAQINLAAGLGQIWRPLTLTPYETRNALFACIVPLAVLVLGVQLEPRERFSLLLLLLTLAATSAVISLLQTLGDPQGALYLYPVTNNGAAVGLFANRNHQALLLAMMLPMLAVVAQDRGPLPQLAAALLGLALLPLILITGSRSGLITAALGLFAIPLVLGWKPRRLAVTPARRRVPRALWLGLALSGIGLLLLTIWLGRGIAWNRLLAALFATEPNADLRLQILPTLFSMIAAYFPVGTGMGSFEHVYQVHEPDALLSSTLMNHAHNDFLELLLTGGAPATLLLLTAAAAFVVRAGRAFSDNGTASRQTLLARLGLVLVGLAGAASASDYPLRTPALAAALSVAVLWTSCSLPQMQAFSGGKDG